ncbi:MAG: septum formation inhibitor Maf [Magnetococcales bacterium]|nr:septum formation inhibitor Maf [Magnetococcales bacterium]
MQLVLASTSPYRRVLLERLGRPFVVRAPDVDEAPSAGESPDALVRRLAEAKARAVATGRGPELIIGSDQVAVIDGEILGKPGTPERAFQQLRRASGNRVSFATGLCLYNTARDQLQVTVVPFHVHFRTLSDQRIRIYLERDRPFDCAGSFKSEGLGITLFRSLEGEDPTALMGLPLITLTTFLEAEGVEP